MPRLNTKNILCLLLAAVLVVLALAASQVSANRATYYFLMDIRDEYSYLLTRWPNTNPDADYCGWEGISCDASGYVTVDLSGKGLSGDLPDLDDDYSHLYGQIMVVSINLSNNNIRDSLEEDWQHLPNLKYVNLDNTYVHDELPWEWQGMGLEELHIANARLCGGLPAWNMKSLSVVDLSNNRMGGSLSESWTAMTSLSSVDISGNAFCGCVPTTWANVAALNTAANGANAAVRDTNCASTNACGPYSNQRCVGTGGSGPTTGGNGGTVGGNAASGVASLAASVAAVVAVAAAMVW